ncbi:hypothetical protein L6R50_19505 [Myxococcota bacterium]|nr:hypothetical protein [Myxococcota bacterium]
MPGEKRERECVELDRQMADHQAAADRLLAEQAELEATLDEIWPVLDDMDDTLVAMESRAENLEELVEAARQALARCQERGGDCGEEESTIEELQAELDECVKGREELELEIDALSARWNVIVAQLDQIEAEIEAGSDRFQEYAELVEELGCVDLVHPDPHQKDPSWME